MTTEGKNNMTKFMGDTMDGNNNEKVKKEKEEKEILYTKVNIRQNRHNKMKISKLF